MNDLRYRLEVEDLSLYYGDFKALEDISFKIPNERITALIGPSGCGKSTLLRCFNRMNDLIDNYRLEGRVLLDGESINQQGYDTTALRRNVGMVFQKPNPFPKTVYDNIAYGPRIGGERSKSTLDGIVEESLKKAALWKEVKSKLRESAMRLSGGQQQRLCIARVIAVEPEVILMDEPCSALDPVATQRIEDLMAELKDNYTIVIVTHNMQQAARASDYTAFIMIAGEGEPGKIVEYGETEKIFTNPEDERTEKYITGRFG